MFDRLYQILKDEFGMPCFIHEYTKYNDPCHTLDGNLISRRNLGTDFLCKGAVARLRPHGPDSIQRSKRSHL